MVVRLIVFLSSANLICRSTDISKCLIESLGFRDNESTVLGISEQQPSPYNNHVSVPLSAIISRLIWIWLFAKISVLVCRDEKVKPRNNCAVDRSKTTILILLFSMKYRFSDVVLCLPTLFHCIRRDIFSDCCFSWVSPYLL